MANKNIKRPEELLKIMKASSIGDACFIHIIGYIREGMTEKQIAGEIEETLKKMGSQGLAFPTIFVSGQNGADPHGSPTDKRIEEGDMLTMDFGAVIGGYCGDMTRTVALGSISSEKQKAYETVLKAQEKALSLCRPGIKCFDIDKAARDIIEKAGYGENFIHGTGHGVGREVHEEPYINKKAGDEDILAENMAITIEPGIYIPGRFGIRIEDLAIISGFGIINTVKSEKKLLIL